MSAAQQTARQRLVGTVDATRDRREATPRPLDEAFGPGARASVVVPMGADAPMHPAERLVVRASAAIGALLVASLLIERFAL